MSIAPRGRRARFKPTLECRFTLFSGEDAMKAWWAAALAAWLCIGCAQNGSPGANSGGSITMYGTIDQGVTFRK
ncbi:hypothetical protein C0Z18_14235 [Trinickia dabaoshanensis]|uniref:Uncharacterized protein n=1 Tax=Trinickia dabaoshanensis TaxID=564714 RepID=A0A2N7VQR4_9BURK|nr:hypothetical protein [Trinickia dabaoshanensis]PMS19467.1 hypothetical protein C0Z18_14235 [Trinickia dabaoshanensis]